MFRPNQGIGDSLFEFPHKVYDVNPEGNCIFRAFSYIY